MGKIIVICGPTATGKTDLAIRLGKELNGEIISADSRQVYQKMDIGTGKDLPHHSQLITYDSLRSSNFGYYEVKGVKIWGYDLVSPTEGFSVARYIGFARKIISAIWRRGKLPILVGGTGLYIKGVVDGIPTANVPKNSKLREIYRDKTVTDLQNVLASFNPFKLAAMNTSDVNNPRRLLRAIEVSSCTRSISSNRLSMNRFIDNNTAILFIGLKADKDTLIKIITDRVNDRLKKGLEFEIKSLLTSGVGWDMQSMQAIGYKEWQSYLLGVKTKNEIISDWIKDEVNYAKRQMTWFKKDRRIVWFDVTDPDWRKKVAMFVKKWNNQK